MAVRRTAMFYRQGQKLELPLVRRDRFQINRLRSHRRPVDPPGLAVLEENDPGLQKVITVEWTT